MPFLLRAWIIDKIVGGSFTISAEREWFWEIQVFETMDKELRRLEIRVYEDRNSKESLTILTAFLSRSPI